MSKSFAVTANLRPELGSRRRRLLKHGLCQTPGTATLPTKAIFAYYGAADNRSLQMPANVNPSGADRLRPATAATEATARRRRVPSRIVTAPKPPDHRPSWMNRNRPPASVRSLRRWCGRRGEYVVVRLTHGIEALRVATAEKFLRLLRLRQAARRLCSVGALRDNLTP